MFKRENRYIVIKNKDFYKLTDEQKKQLNDILLLINDDTNYVVVKESSPEYEMVWKMIEERVTNTESKSQGGNGCDVVPS